MTIVTATEFKTNLGKYLSLVEKEEIAISKNGRLIAQLIPYRHRISDSLVGVVNETELPEDFDGDFRKMIREMRVRDYEDLD